MSPELQELLSQTLLDRDLREAVLRNPDLISEQFDLSVDEIHYVTSQLDIPSIFTCNKNVGMLKYSSSFPGEIDIITDVMQSDNAVRLSNPDYYVRPVTVVTTTTTVNTVTTTITTTAPTDKTSSLESAEREASSVNIVDLAKRIKQTRTPDRLSLVRSFAKAVAAR